MGETNMSIDKYQGGFSFIELVIVLAIIVILAAVAVPSYLNHLREAEFSATVTAAHSLKSVVAECIEKKASVIGCSQGAYSIPVSVPAATGTPGTTVIHGVITATAPPNAQYHVAGATYILTPTVVNNTVTWAASGGGVTNGYAG